MTDSELKQEEDKLYALRRSNQNRTPSKQKLRELELRCVKMINSVLAYRYDLKRDNADYILQEEEQNHSRYLPPFVLELGRKRVIELINCQLRDIKRIERNTFTDDEGCTYNSIIWAR